MGGKIARPYKVVHDNGWTEIIGPRDFAMLTTAAAAKQQARLLNDAYAVGYQDAQLASEYNP